MGATFILPSRLNNSHTTTMNNAVAILLFIGTAFAAQQTTVEFLAGDGRFTTLVSLASKVGLIEGLNNGTFTIFAPTDAAFAALPAEVTAAITSNATLLVDTLVYHAVPGRVPSSAASDELLVTTLTGAVARFNVYPHNNKITIEGSVVSQPDIMASNGIIHVIDSVMMAPTGNMVDYVAGNPELSTLLSLVTQAGLAGALDVDGLTLFAPTNAAFSRVAEDQLNQITGNPAVLAAVLKYHVVANTIYSAGLYQKESIPTLNVADSLMVNMIPNQAAVRINNNALVTSADNGVINGVVHLIDHVLIPQQDPIVG